MTKAVTFCLRVPDTCDTSNAEWMQRHPERMKQQEKLRRKLAEKTMGALPEKVKPPLR